MHIPKYLTLFLFSPLFVTSLTAAEDSNELLSLAKDQQSLAITIYNNDLALVKDTRAIKLSKGIQTIALRDVSAQIRPETALFKSINAVGSISVLEQNFDFDLLTPEKLLEKYVGKTVNLLKSNPATGVETNEVATVLSANNGVVLKIGNRIETGPFNGSLNGKIVFDTIPANLRDRPTLTTVVNNKVAQQQTVELSYLTGGLGWKADYVAELNAKEDSIDLSSWVTLSNTSGATYQHAKLQLVAGDVNRVHPQGRPMVKTMRSDMAMAEAAMPMQEESLLEYHLYTLDRATTIADNQTKQVALLSAQHIPARKELVLKGADYYYQGQYGEIGTKMKVGVFVEFDNTERAQLGLPLPKGILRVYKKDNAGNAQFVGEDTIDHTPKNETVRLKLGDAFDVTADKKQTQFKVLPKPTKGINAFESAYEITLKNAKKEKVVVSVQEPISGDWKILSESAPHRKANSQLAIWQIEVPAEGSTTLSYRAQVKY
ncbi:DUF4139 domain-containing protein [Methylotenera sp. 1P/1]|uniref:DUF4139 domain-containing protein n=1 Tax=Methylotenera sp. 1P/1 TaxID=1131551 RepID=UPI00036745FE|nr:DUF4139 domain-containing protein [Methylotenera sp. 1P/1]